MKYTITAEDGSNTRTVTVYNYFAAAQARMQMIRELLDSGHRRTDTVGTWASPSGHTVTLTTKEEKVMGNQPPTIYHVARLAIHQGQQVWVHTLTTPSWDKVKKHVANAKTMRVVWEDTQDSVPTYQASFANAQGPWVHRFENGEWDRIQMLGLPFYRKLPGVTR